MVDKVRALKFENSASGGTEFDLLPTETDPSEDYHSVKGVAFEGLDTFRLEKKEGIIDLVTPDWSNKPIYLGNGELDYIEFFVSSTQTTANRRAKVTMAYDGSLNPTTETWVFYSESNGTTIVRTYTLTHTWSGVDHTKTESVQT